MRYCHDEKGILKPVSCEFWKLFQNTFFIEMAKSKRRITEKIDTFTKQFL